MRRLVPAIWPFLLSACVPEVLTPAPGTIREGAPPVFLLVGDTQKTMTLEFWRPHFDAERLDVIRALAAEEPAFIVNAGDVVCHGGSRTDWKRFCDENEPVFSRRIAYFPVLGNHDYYGGERTAFALRAEVFPHLQGRRWYDIRFGSILIVVLDSNFDELTREQIGRQDEWLSAILAAAEGDAGVRHVILVCHHPPYTNALGLSESPDVQGHFVPRITPKVRAFCSGHVHNYEHFRKNGVHFLVSGGGGGPSRELAVGDTKHKDLYSGPRTRPFHYCRFRVEGTALLCDVFMLQNDGSWKRVDGFECP